MSSRRASTLFQLVYVLLVLLTICVTALSCIFLLSQAVRHSPDRTFRNNFDVSVIGAAYVILAFLSLALCLNRRITVHRRLQRISKTFHTVGKNDVRESVFWYIQQEYTRACLVAYESRPKHGEQAGWAKPGTALEGTRFRTALLDTVRPLDKLAHLVLPRHPTLRPHARPAHHFRFIRPLLPHDADGGTPLEHYDAAVQLARHGSREPTELEFAIGMNAAKEIEKTLHGIYITMHDGSTTDLGEESMDHKGFD